MTGLAPWIARMSDLFYRSTGVKPAIRPLDTASPDQHTPTLWCRSNVAGGSETLFAGAAESSWQAIASRLGASADAREAYLKFLAESLGAKPIETGQAPPSRICQRIEIAFPESEPILLQFVAVPNPCRAHSAVDLLLDIEFPLMIRFGKTRMLLRDLLAVNTGSIIGFGQRVSDPVEILVQGKVIARGEAVIVGGNYGVRITETSTLNTGE